LIFRRRGLREVERGEVSEIERTRELLPERAAAGEGRDPAPSTGFHDGQCGQEQRWA
jgi:hypothetical protein